MARYYVQVGAEVEVEDEAAADDLADRLVQIVIDSQLVEIAFQATEPDLLG
jgi:hypothetical protein